MAEETDPLDEFLRRGCLTYADDGPEHWARARELLAARPDIADDSIHAAVAANDVERVDRLLAADPTRATLEGGPFDWPPLLYLTYSRVHPDVPRDAVLAIARRLLDNGADPNSGYLWDGTYPFTALTGTFGEGELGAVRQPRHPHSLALARVLLEAGADANDAQALYNRMFLPDNDHLELLFEFGLGRGDGGPWKHQLGAAAASPIAMVRGQLEWAVTHGMVERTQLLFDHSVDIVAPFADGYTPSSAAALSGHAAIVELLVARGAEPPELSPPESLIAAALDGDRPAVERIRAAYPDALVEAHARRPGLIVWAAAQRPDSVALCVDLGFDVNALGRSDTPIEGRWETALHVAAGDGDADLVRLLLALGADPSIRDARFDATARGWARYFDQPGLADLLPPDPES